MQEAMKDGKVQAKNYVILILGFAGTGKTHVLYLLLGEPPPQLRVSTPAVKSPVRAVSMTKACTSGKMWKRVEREDEIRMVAELAGSLSDGPVRKATNHLVLTVPATNDPLPTLTDLTASKDPLEVSESAEIIGGEAVVEDRSLSSVCSDIVGDISREMIKCRDSHRTLKVTSFIIIDSGGQPQFLEALPFFLRKRILHLFVQKLNERLRDFPDVELFGDDGKSIGTPYPSTLSNEQILRHFIRFVQSSSSAEYPPRFAIIGTHRDLEKECLETLADKNSSIAELLPSSVKQHAIKLGEDFIIPLNVKTPDEDDNKVIADLRLVIQSIPIEEAEIPLRWYGLELIMQRLVEKLGRGILKVSECEQAAKELPLSPESLHEGLKYLDRLNIIHYYSELLPKIVFCNSQVLLDKVSELVKECYRLREAVNGPEEREFCNHGLVSRSRLSKFDLHYRDGLFSEDDLLSLFSSLFLITKVSKDKYLMPCLLPVVEALAPSVPPPASLASIPPLLLYFPNGGVRLGVFCAFLSYLLTEAKWELFGKSGNPVRIFRNSASFKLPGEIPCRVTISDSMSSYLKVAVHISSQISPEETSVVCPDILCTVRRGLEVVADKMHYSDEDMESHVAFFCPGHKQGVETSDSPHPAKVASSQKRLICSNDDMIFSRLGDEHDVWFAEQTGESSKLICNYYCCISRIMLVEFVLFYFL